MGRSFYSNVPSRSSSMELPSTSPPRSLASSVAPPITPERLPAGDPSKLFRGEYGRSVFSKMQSMVKEQVAEAFRDICPDRAANCDSISERLDDLMRSCDQRFQKIEISH